MILDLREADTLREVFRVISDSRFKELEKEFHKAITLATDRKGWYLAFGYMASKCNTNEELWLCAMQMDAYLAQLETPKVTVLAL